MALKLEVIFVRHGESCANILKEKFPHSPLRYSYQDPQLTERGIQRSILTSKPLLEFIKRTWGANKTYMIGASAMMRAQMTAYYQLAASEKKPIHVFPHICEKGITPDNLPYEKTKQQLLLRQRDPKVLQYLASGKDYREVQTLSTKSDLSLFLEWVKSNLSLFKQTSQGSVRLVVFTHGMLIRSLFTLPEGTSLTGRPILDNRIMNNGFVYTQYHIGPTDYPNFQVFHDPEQFILPYKCPDKCSRSICKKQSGGTRKTKKTRRNRS